MKALLLATAAALSLSGAAFAQTLTTPGMTTTTDAAASVTAPAASVTGSASVTTGATSSPDAGAATPASGTQTTATVTPPAATVAASATFTDAEVKKIASIAEETRRINAEGQAKIAAATTPEAKAAATDALRTALQGAVTTQGMTVERYNEIARAAAADPALTARISSASAAAQGTAAPASTTAPQ
jgi:hypothetical protein